MPYNINYSISPNIHRTFNQLLIRKFLMSNLEDFNDFKEKENIPENIDLYFSRLLDRAIDKGKITKDQAEKFLIDELNYGKLRNLFIYFIQDTSHLEDIENIKQYINSLSRFYNIKRNVQNFPYINNLNTSSEQDEIELVYSDIETDNNGKVNSIYMLFSKGIFADSNEINYYIGIEINVRLKLLVIKLRDKLNEWDSETKMHHIQSRFKVNLANCFSLGIPLATNKVQKLVYTMTSDLTNSVLTPVISKVNEHLEDSIDEQINIWNKSILEKAIDLTPKDIEGIKNSILNNYYRIYMQNVVGKINLIDLKQKYKVSGYPRTVKFLDDTIGEGKAKSSDTKESLLDTSVYYDIKSRLDHSKSIRFSTIYWIDVPNSPIPIGTTFHIEANNRFRCNMLPKYFNKEMCDYVLQKIAKYL